MADRRVKILPVIEEGSLRGVITRMDILTLHVLNPGGSDLERHGLWRAHPQPYLGRDRSWRSSPQRPRPRTSSPRRSPHGRREGRRLRPRRGPGLPRGARGRGGRLAVVTAEEGAELRRAEIRVPVLVFTDLLPDRLRLAEEYRLIVTAHSLASARRMAARPGLEAHLKVNTGMNRWGVEPSEVGEAQDPGPQLKGVYTHLASADRDEGETRRQISTFDEVLAAHSSGARWCTLRTRLASLWHRRPAMTACGRASPSTASTLWRRGGERPTRGSDPRWFSRAMSPMCGGLRRAMGYPTG